jgi:isoleucyl-tRNA synthetase
MKREYLDDALNDRWERIWEMRAVATKALEEARKEKAIGLSLDAQVHLYLSEKNYQFLQPYQEDLKSIFIVSSVILHPAASAPAIGAKDEKEVRVEVLRAEGVKCERCWNYDVTVGRHEGHRTICQRCIDAIQ